MRAIVTVLFLILGILVPVTPGQDTKTAQSPASNPASPVELKPDSWEKFTSKEGGFSAIFPGVPEQKEQTIALPNGDGQLLMHSYIAGTNAEYGVIYSDYATPIEGTEKLEEFLNAVRDAGVKGINGHLLEEKEISFDGHPGRFYQVEFGDGYVLSCKSFVVKNRLYLVTATTYGKRAATDIARVYDSFALRFFDSFNPTPEVQSPHVTSSDGPGEVDRMLPLLKDRTVIYGSCPDCAGKTDPAFQGRALSLPQPTYPAIARAAHASGAVSVRVILDEKGDVIAAQALSGHPLLLGVSVAAARQARFTPALLKGKPAMLVGVIVYNFVLR